MKLKNLVNNTQVFNRPCVGKQNALTDFWLAQKNMAELKPLGLVVTNHNAATNPQDQTEVPCPLSHILYIFFPNNGALPYEKRQVSCTDDLLELCPSLGFDTCLWFSEGTLEGGINYNGLQYYRNLINTLKENGDNII